MIITITEMGDKIYTVDIKRHSRRRRVLLTRGLRDALKGRGRLLWKTKSFGKGRLGSQAQYTV